MTSVPRAAVRAEPNVTPMIDVMLVLLIIFMVVGPTLVEGPPFRRKRASRTAIPTSRAR